MFEISVFVFDVDDTLYDQKIPFQEALNFVFSSKGWLRSLDVLACYTKFRYFSDLVFEKTVSGEMSLEEMRIYRITQALELFEISITEEEAILFQEAYLVNQGKIVMQEDLLNFLAELSQKNQKIAILTNGPTQHQKRKLEQLNLNHLVDPKYQFISESIGFSKPDVKAFNHVASHFPTETKFIYVGDSYTNDVEGAKSAGWNVIWINKYNMDREKIKILPDIEVTDYKELYLALCQAVKK